MASADTNKPAPAAEQKPAPAAKPQPVPPPAQPINQADHGRVRRPYGGK